MTQYILEIQHFLKTLIFATQKMPHNFWRWSLFYLVKELQHSLNTDFRIWVVSFLIKIFIWLFLSIQISSKDLNLGVKILMSKSSSLCHFTPVNTTKQMTFEIFWSTQRIIILLLMSTRSQNFVRQFLFTKRQFFCRMFDKSCI